MQRVAIARALVNNPDIVLADEPTGALDSKTSVQIMKLLKEIADDKLVIMVTHNPELAKEYSTRIVNVKDGKIVGDTKPFDESRETNRANDTKKHSSMSLLTALSLSKNNLMTKRGRTIMTAVAGSIGIIGIAIILALARGVNNYASQIAGKTTTATPITVRDTYIDSEEQTRMQLSSLNEQNKKTEHNDSLLATDDLYTSSFVTNKKAIRQNDVRALKSYIDQNRDKIDNSVEAITYDYGVDLQVYDKDANGQIVQVNPINLTTVTRTDGDDLASLLSDKVNEVSIDSMLKSSFKELVSYRPYEILSGRMPENSNELVLIVDTKNELPLSVMYSLNITDRTK